jgi:hypothetical protein
MSQVSCESNVTRRDSDTSKLSLYSGVSLMTVPPGSSSVLLSMDSSPFCCLLLLRSNSTASSIITSSILFVPSWLWTELLSGSRSSESFLSQGNTGLFGMYSRHSVMNIFLPVQACLRRDAYSTSASSPPQQSLGQVKHALERSHLSVGQCHMQDHPRMACIQGMLEQLGLNKVSVALPFCCSTTAMFPQILAILLLLSSYNR